MHVQLCWILMDWALHLSSLPIAHISWPASCCQEGEEMSMDFRAFGEYLQGSLFWRYFFVFDVLHRFGVVIVFLWPARSSAFLFWNEDAYVFSEGQSFLRASATLIFFCSVKEESSHSDEIRHHRNCGDLLFRFPKHAGEPGYVDLSLPVSC